MDFWHKKHVHWSSASHTFPLRSRMIEWFLTETLLYIINEKRKGEKWQSGDGSKCFHKEKVYINFFHISLVQNKSHGQDWCQWGWRS